MRLLFMLLLLGSSLCFCQGKSADKSKDQAKGSLVVSVLDPPRAVSTPGPKWSREARRKKVRGLVALNGTVAFDGSLRNLKVTRSLDPRIDLEAMDAVRRWKFSPCTKDGKPLECPIALEVAFP